MAGANGKGNGKGKGGIAQVAPRILAKNCGCPPPPPPGYKWVQIDMDGEKNPTDADPANRRIEQDYRHENQKSVVLTDSQLEKGGIVPNVRYTRLPYDVEGKLSREDKVFLNRFLDQFQGYPRGGGVYARQLCPDIMDFTLRVMYEIKTQRNREKGFRQLHGDYRLAEAIIEDEAGHQQGFNRDLARWTPRHTYAFPGNLRRYICTGLTDYDQKSKVPSRKDKSKLVEEDHSGLIIYRVWELQEEEKDDEKEERVSKPVHIIDMVPEVRLMREKLQKEIDRKLPPAPVGTEYYILAPPIFWQKFVEDPRFDQRIDSMRVHAFDAKRNPVLGFRNLMITIGIAVLGPVAVVYLIVTLGAVIVMAAPAAGAGAAVGTGVGLEAGGVGIGVGLEVGTGAVEVGVGVGEGAVAAGEGIAAIDTAAAAAVEVDAAIGAAEYAYVARTVAASQAAQHMGHMALVLGIVTVAKKARADGGKVEIEEMNPILCVPAGDVEPDPQVDRKVTYQGKPYFIIGRAGAV